MSKFRVTIVKKNGQPVGVRAAAINGRTIVLGKFGRRKRSPRQSRRRAAGKNLVLVFVGV